MTTQKINLQLAVQYAKKGKLVFPVYSITDSGRCSCGKECSSPAKHPMTPHGFKDATLDLEQIERWWEENPKANIGIQTGEKSGWIVLDIDPRNGGNETLSKLEEKYGKLPETVECLTGGGGRHIYFKHPGGFIKGGAHILGSGIDIKADGGYVLAPPSNHISGKEYTWKTSTTGKIELAFLPDWLLNQLTDQKVINIEDHRKSPNSSDWIVNALKELKEGNRNDSFTKLIGRFHYDGHSPEEIYTLLAPHAEKVGYDLGGLQDQIKGICERYPNDSKKKDTSYAYSAFFAPSKENWPTLKEEALYGLAGDIVKTIDPYTEADQVATLTNLLVTFGSCVGAKPYFPVSYARHYPRIFVGQVGDSSKGRKGTGWSSIRYLIGRIEENWAKNCIASGLSTGEGLIYHVRDEQWKKRATKEEFLEQTESRDLIDEGVSDKRLLVVEEELAAAFKVMSREGNNLSPIIRDAWDRGDLKSLVKNSPIKATGAHVSLIGHITTHELTRSLSETEKSNGFANRFIWVLVKRSKFLPNPQEILDHLLNPLIIRLGKALQFAKTTEQIKRDEEAEKFWGEIYGPLSEGKPGLLGSILARAEAQVMRLALLHALLNSSKVITLDHLKAALALWEYSEASTKIIFGNKLGDPTADTILMALKDQNEMSETDFNCFFGKHKSSEEIQRAFRMLEKLNLVSKREEDTGGRPKTLWKAA